MPPRPRNSHLLEQVRLGDEIEIWWPHDAQYYRGVVGSRLPSGRHRILYNDGDVEDLTLATEQWRFTGLAAQRVLASQSTSPPLDMASPGTHSDNSPFQPNPSPQDTRLSESTSTGKTSTIKKRGRPKSQKSDSSKPAAPKTIKAKNSSSIPTSGKTTDSSKVTPASSTSPAPRTTTTKLKKRQRSSSTTVERETQETTNPTVTSQDPPSPDVDSGLIDAAPLGVSTMNSTVTSQPSTLTSKPSTASVPVAVPSVNSGETVDAFQTKASINRRTSVQITPAAPVQSVTKPTASQPSSSALGNTPSTTASANRPRASTNNAPSVHHRASTAPKVTNHQSSRRKNSSSALGTHVTASQSKVPVPPRTEKQPPNKQQKLAEKDKPITKTLGKNVTAKERGTSTPAPNKEGGSRPSESKSVQTLTSPAPLSQPSTQKPNSSKNVHESTSRLANGHGSPNNVSGEAPMALGRGEKDLHQTSNKNKNQSSEKQVTGGNCPAQTKLRTASAQNGATGNESVKQNSVKLQAKGPPKPVLGKGAESSPTPKTMTGATGPLMAVMTRVANDVTEHKRLASGAKGRSSSSRPDDSRSGPLPANSRGTGSPRKSIDGIFKRGSRPNADAKGTSRSKAGNLAKLSAVKRSISKPAKSPLQKQAVQTLSPRPAVEPTGRRTEANPDDGRDIVANVNVPRKPRGGPASPLLRSPLGGLRPPLSSPNMGRSLSGGMGPKSTNGVDLKDFSLQQTQPAGTSVRGDRSLLLKTERSGSKLGPFQPTKRRSGIHRQSAVSQGEQRNLTDSLSKKTQSTNLHQSVVQDKERRLPSLAKSSRSEAATVPPLPNSIPVGANAVTGKPKQTSSIPDSEQAVSGARRASSSEKKMRSNSVPLKKSISTSLAQAKDLVRCAGENRQESMDRSKPRSVAAKDLPKTAKGITANTVGDSPQLQQQTEPRVEHRGGIVSDKEEGSIRGNASPTPVFETIANVASEAQLKRGAKRTGSEQGSEGKRRKLDPRKKQDLKQVAKAATLSLVRDSSSSVPKILPKPSPPVHQDSAMKHADRIPSKMSLKPFNSKSLAFAALASSAAQTEQLPSGVTKGKGDKKRDDGREQPERERMADVEHQRSGSSLNQAASRGGSNADVRAELRASEKTQIERAQGLKTQGADISGVVEGAPSAVTNAKAAISTATLQLPQSGYACDGAAARGDVIGRSSAHQPGSKASCGETVAEAPTSANEDVISKETGRHSPRREDQQIQRCPDPQPTNTEPTVALEFQQGIMTDSRASARESQLSSAAPRSFARVRSKQSTGSVPDNGNARSTGHVTQDLDLGNASLQLEFLLNTITEANKKSLQSRLAPLSSRFENFFADNDRFLRSLQGQIEKATKTMELLREDLARVQNSVSGISSIAEINTFLESHAHETRQTMTQEMKIATSEVKEDLRDYLKRELEGSMNKVAAQIQKDSVMLISKAIDNAISSGPLQDHPRIAVQNGEEDDFDGEREGPIQGEGNESSNYGGLAKYAGMDSDDIPLAHRFGLKAGTAFGSADGGGAERNLRPDGGGSANQDLMEKGSASVGPKSNKSKGKFLPPSRAANLSGQKNSVLSESRDKPVKVPQVEGSGHGPKDINVNSASSAVSREPQAPTSSSNALQASQEAPIGHQTHENESAVNERDHEDVKMASQPHPARRENYTQLTHQVRILLARCAVEWFLSGGCRDFAPSNERTTPVSVNWVNGSVLRCLDGIVRRLENEDTFEGAMKDLADSVGPEIETAWLLEGPTVFNISKARKNYTEWDPKLYDFEWESEKRVLANLSEKLIRSEQSLIESGEIFEDLLYTATRYVQHASKSNAVQSTR